MGDMENNPYKIAQVCKINIWLFEKVLFSRKFWLDFPFLQVIRKFKMIAENNSYFLNVGPK